jgi:putative ABC transport system permease protein
VTASDRIFGLLLRAYPERVRAQFGEGMHFALRADLDLARSRGLRAAAWFWVITIVEAGRFAVAQRGGFTMRGMFTVDWRDAGRSLRAAPMVTAFAVVSLALGIGGVTALFSIMNGLALRPLPVRDPGRLVLLSEAAGGESSWTNPIWEAVRDRQQAFAEGAFAWATDRFNLSPAASSDIVDGLWISGAMFDVLGVAPILGRGIDAGDDVRGGGRDGAVAVISYDFWQRRFGGAPDVIGRTLTIERVPFTIAGVTPAGFFGPDVGRMFDVAIPLGTEPMVRPRDNALDQRSTWWMNVMARLKPGVTAEQATAQLQALHSQIREATMPPGRSNLDQSRYLSDPLVLVPAPAGRSPLRRQYREPLTILLWLAGIVLLIASANIASLLLARASARRYELTLRLALGASRLRLARQLLAESLLLAGAGAVLGLLLARWGSRALIAQLTTFATTVQLDLPLDWRVLGFTITVTGFVAILSGVAPALTVSRLSPNEALKEQGRAASLERRGGLRQISTILQVALSLTLVVGAGLFTRTFVALATRDAGFTRGGVLLVTANVDRNPVDGTARVALFERFAEAARAVPGAAGAAVSLTTPVGRAGMNTMIAVPAESTLSRRERMSWVNQITPGWFATFGFRLSAGRDFDARDRPGAPRVAVVNRTFERRFLGGRSALGATFRTVGPSPSVGNPPYEIVGVVEDAVYRSLRAPMDPTMFLPVAQAEGLPASITIAVRSAAGPPSSLAHTVAAAIETRDGSAVLSFRTLDQQINASLTQERLVATLAGFFGVLGLLLAAVGLYGVTASAVTSRRAEIGIRMALGASARGVVAMVLRRVAWLVGLGMALGAGLSVWAATYIRTLLYGLDARDPATFVSAAALLMLVAAVAAGLPARRASRIDPMRVLRNS